MGAVKWSRLYFRGVSDLHSRCDGDSVTKSQVNRLGEELRQPGPPDDETLARLQGFRAAYDAPMAKAQAVVQQSLGVPATARLKTVNTIIEKLRRARTRLAEMQDIAGLRIVRDMELREQDALVQQLAGVFPGAKVVDRRSRPSHGYRAVHVIVTVDGHLVEIQVRTYIQDLWAQAMERLADEVGREVRYGRVPEAAAARVAQLQSATAEVASIEDEYRRLRVLEPELVSPNRMLTGAREVALRHGTAERLRATLTARSSRVCDFLRGMLVG